MTNVETLQFAAIDGVLWGLNSWGLLAPGVKVVVAAAALAAGTLTLSRLPFPSGARSTAIAGLLSLPLFHMARDQTHLLGDGRYWIGLTGESNPYHPYQPLGFAVPWLATLDLRTAAPTARAARLENVSVLLGSLAILLMIVLARRIAGPDSRDRWLAFTTLLACGATQFGFGYVESYPVLWVAVLFTLTWVFSPTRPRPVVAALGLGVAIAAHGTAMLLVPAFLVYIVSVRLRWTRLLFSGIAFVLPVFAAYLLAPTYLTSIMGDQDGAIRNLAGAVSIIREFVPDTAHRAALPLTQLNLWLLLAPGAILLLLASLARDGVRSACRRVGSDPTARFLALATIGLTAPALILNTGAWRGAGADWDTFAVSAVPLSAFAARMALLPPPPPSPPDPPGDPHRRRNLDHRLIRSRQRGAGHLD